MIGLRLVRHPRAPAIVVAARPIAPSEASRRWADRLRRIFEVDPLACIRCGGTMRIVACITDRAVIDRILTHLHTRATLARTPGPRGKPGRRSVARRCNNGRSMLRPPPPPAHPWRRDSVPGASTGAAWRARTLALGPPSVASNAWCPENRVRWLGLAHARPTRYAVGLTSTRCAPCVAVRYSRWHDTISYPCRPLRTCVRSARRRRTPRDSARTARACPRGSTRPPC